MISQTDQLVMNSRKTINGNGNSRKRTIDEDGEDPLEGFRQREPPARMANEAALPQQQQRASGAAESELVQELVRRLGQNSKLQILNSHFRL